MSAPTRFSTSVTKAASNSRSVLALTMCTCCPMARAAFCTSRDWISACGLLWFTSIAISAAVGTISRSSSIRFASSATANRLTPVTLPPGRLRLATRPSLTGSSPITKTIGIVAVADLAASTAGAPPIAAIAATLRPASSAAIVGKRS